jgi:hypothetical protein
VPDDTTGLGDGRPDQVVAREEGAPGFSVIKLYPLSPDGIPIGRDIGIGRAGYNNHSPSISNTPAQGASAHTINVAWIESAAGDASGLGRVMWQRFAGDLAPANDNATWVADRHGTSVVGCEPSVAGLAGGETLLTWIDADGNAHGRLYPAGEPASENSVDAEAYAVVNAALAELGLVAATPDGSRRLQVIEQRPGNLAVMWLALADSGLVLRGSMFTIPLDPASEGASHPSGMATQITDVRLPPGFTGPYSLNDAGDGSTDVVVSYGSGSERGSVTLARRIEGPDNGANAGKAGLEFVVGADTAAAEEIKIATAYVAPIADAPVQGDVSAHASAEAFPVRTSGQVEPIQLVLKIAGPLETPPVVTALERGFAVTWTAPGSTDNAVSINMAMFDERGVPRILSDGGTVIEVTDNASASVAPAIADAGSGAAVSYVDATDGAMMLKAYDGKGDQIGSEVVVDTGADGAISEIAMASHPSETDSGGEGSGDDGGGEDDGNAEEGSGNDELVVVYVRDDHDDQPEYGSIVLQRYSVPQNAEESSELVALGGDGEHDGDDAPVVLTSESEEDPAVSDNVEGRAPAVAGLDHGELAVVWVEADGTRETIRGRVLEADGSQVLCIDITGLLEQSGIAKGTEPILIANGDGDILVSWLQPDGAAGDDEDDDDGGGYVVMAALYESAGAGQWVAPDGPMRLQQFEEEPKDFYVTWSDAGGTAIDVTWRDDSSGSGKGLLSQGFDLDGNDVGRARKVPPSDGDQLSVESLSTAGLVDGQIVVVYTEQSSDGDLDLAAHVVDTQTGDTATLQISDDALPSREDADIALAVNRSVSTKVDQEIAVHVAAAELGATVSHVNGVPISSVTPVDVGSGWVQLREDGWLTVNPDAGYAGTIAFDYTLAGRSNGAAATNRLTVTVAPEVPPVPASEDYEAGPADAELSEADVKLADIDMGDEEIGTEGLARIGLDADEFKIVGSTLYLKAGIEFDLDKPTLSVEVRPARSEQAAAVNFSLDVKDSVGSVIEDDLSADTLVFAPGFDAAGDLADDAYEPIDMSSSGYSTFQELLDSGALVQAGEDVVITVDPSDPANSDKITLRGIDLSALTSADFRF